MLESVTTFHPRLLDDHHRGRVRVPTQSLDCHALRIGERFLRSEASDNRAASIPMDCLSDPALLVRARTPTPGSE